MTVQFILTDYVDRAMAQAVYHKLEDGMFAGKVPPCPGVVAFAETLRDCEAELHSVLEDWLLVGLKMKHALPVIEATNNSWLKTTATTISAPCNVQNLAIIQSCSISASKSPRQSR